MLMLQSIPERSHVVFPLLHSKQLVCFLEGEAPWVGVASLLQTLLQLLILAQHPPSQDQTAEDGQTTAGNDDTATHLVTRGLVCQEEVGREPMRDTAGAVGNGDQGGSLGTGTRDNCGFPGNVQVQSDEGTAAEKE
jgi:hypothetical protein